MIKNLGWGYIPYKVNNINVLIVKLIPQNEYGNILDESYIKNITKNILTEKQYYALKDIEILKCFQKSYFYQNEFDYAPLYSSIFRQFPWFDVALIVPQEYKKPILYEDMNWFFMFLEQLSTDK